MQFQDLLEKTGEVGYVEESLKTILYIKGLPGAHPQEVVYFESGEPGLVLSMDRKAVEVLLLSHSQVDVGTRVARSGEYLSVSVSEALLGNVINPLGKAYYSDKSAPAGTERRIIDTIPSGFVNRKDVDVPLETGVSIIDLLVPLGKGQRELVVGDRKTGKTPFLAQVVLAQATAGAVCIYAAIGKQSGDIAEINRFFESKDVAKNIIMVASASSDPAGYVYLTPYTAMTIAEYFRDLGRDVLIVMDDMTAHAKYYREISLLARRFPGRASYPGDIFYTHSRLLERAGAFTKGSITCLPIAEAALGDISGYIQTNLMSITDGHIFFDSDLFNQGKRPAINPFLSVTRVGHQAQTQLTRELSTELTRFLLEQARLKQFLHFGAELSEEIKQALVLGEKIETLFDQAPDVVVPLNINIIFIACLKAGYWRNADIAKVTADMKAITAAYQTKPAFKNEIDQLISSSDHFDDLVREMSSHEQLIFSPLNVK